MLCSEHVYVRAVSILGALENVPEYSEGSNNITKLIYQQQSSLRRFKIVSKLQAIVKPATSAKENLFVYLVSFHGP